MSKQKPWELRAGRRKRPKRALRKKYLIVTEGQTEAAYFSHYRTTTGPDIVPVSAGANKLALVRIAVQMRAERIKQEKYEEATDVTWVAMDRDVDPKNSRDKQLFNEALELASREKIKIAFSNDSFELWYLLHFQEVTTPMHRRDIDKKLSEHLGRTYKSRHTSKVEDLFGEILPNLPEALRRAERLAAAAVTNGVPPEQANPSTSVHELIQAIISEDGFRFL